MQNPTPAFILVAPQMGENIGAAARAMLNFGLTDLRIVNPRDGWPSKQAQAMAVGALEKIPPVQVFDTLARAITDCQRVYATTARPRDMAKTPFDMRDAATDANIRADRGEKVAFVFGPENAGLSNDDVALCHEMIIIPVNPDFSSINLAQATMLAAYEWIMTQSPPAPAKKSESPPVSHEKLNEFLVRLETELETLGFFKARELKPTMVRNIRTMFMRRDLTDQDVRTLHGMVSALMGKKLT